MTALLQAVYSILDNYRFPLVRSRVECECDCPGGASSCHGGRDMCGNSTNCHTYYNPSVQSRGCFLQWLKLSASICCQIQVTPDIHTRVRNHGLLLVESTY